MVQEKSVNFMRGAGILTASTLLVKVLALLFSVPLANIISPDKMSYFYTAYEIFSTFLMMSTTGLPVAVSRMVGAAFSQGRRREADRVFSVAFWLFFSIGLAGSLIMFFFARQIAVLLQNPGAEYAIMALAPTLFFLSVMSSLRGYFQGRSNMVPTAVSQTIEAVTKVIVGIGLVMILIKKYNSDGVAVVGAILGVSVSAGLGMLYLSLCKARQRKKDDALGASGETGLSSRKEMLMSLVRFAVPITLGSCFLSVLDNVDSAILMNRLQTGAGFTLEFAETCKGLLGHARKFFDLPGAFVVPISTSLLPALAGAIASNDKKNTESIAHTSVRVTLLISIPASVGMCLFSYPICGLLLAGNARAAEGTAPLLAALSVAIAFSSSLLTTNAILQAFGKATTPVVHMAIGGVTKIILSFVLIGIPSIGAMGAAVSTAVSYLLIVVLNFISVRRCVPSIGKTLRAAVPMLFSALVMGGVSYGCYLGLCRFLPARAAVLPAIIIAVAVYAVCVVVFKAVTYDDVAALPKGEKLAELLHIKKDA